MLLVLFLLYEDFVRPPLGPVLVALGIGVLLVVTALLSGACRARLAISLRARLGPVNGPVVADRTRRRPDTPRSVADGVEGPAAGHRAEHPDASRVEVTNMIGYAVIVEQADGGGYGAWSPDLSAV